MSVGATEKKIFFLATLPSTVNWTVLLQMWRRRNIGNLLPRCYHCVNKHQHTYIQPTSALSFSLILYLDEVQRGGLNVRSLGVWLCGETHGAGRLIFCNRSDNSEVNHFSYPCMSVFPLVSPLSLQCIVQTAPMISVAGIMFAQPQTDGEPDQGPCFGRRFHVSIGTQGAEMV